MPLNPFANSKAALVFAATTIIGALAVVGTSDSGGTLDRTLERLTQQRETIAEEARDFSEERSEVSDAPLDPASGWGSTGEAVFGEYDAEEPSISEQETAPSPSQPWRPNPAPVGAPGPTGEPVPADSPGVPDPREDDQGWQAAPPR